MLHRGLGSFEHVDRFLAVSHFVRRKHLDAGFPAERFAVKANFTWPVAGRVGAGEHLLYLGRLSREKGVDTILDAWGAAGTAAPLVVAGDGPDGDRLRARAPSGVRFLGSVPPEEVQALLRDARALLVPSRWYEAAPRSIIEAYATGVPVLASDIGALPESVIDGVTGMLVPPDEPDAWGEAMRGLDDAASMRLGVGAFDAWRDRYSPDRGLAALEFAYRDVMTSGSRTG
jgi:glycosyltransferase involved in cell wall biosynthesis